MAKMHHCPNDGAQPCNAAGSIIHVCPLCYARWDEVIPEDKPAPAPTPSAPPVRDEDTSILDASESWLDYDLAEILRFRLSLVRGKAPRRVAEARVPDSILATVQEGAMASKPIDTEIWFTKKPTLLSPFSAPAPPSGPSADLTKVDLTSNPSVPRRVDGLVSRTDLRAREAVTDLFDPAGPPEPS